MKLELRAKGVELTSCLQEFIRNKLRSALGQFSHLVRGVRVRLTDVNGPRGGEDAQCQIRASLGHAGVVTINETRADPYVAVARASLRTGENVSRQVARLRAARRGR